MEFLVVLLMSVVMAFVAHEGAKYANIKVPRLNLSPNWFAIIAFLFSAPGMVALLVYALVKYMVKK